jgi:exosome complex exonuclease RRP6
MVLWRAHEIYIFGPSISTSLEGVSSRAAFPPVISNRAVLGYMTSSSDASDSEDVPSPSTSVSEYLAYLQNQIQPLTRTAAQLPGPSDLSFHRSLDRSLLKDLDSARDDIVSTLNSLLGRISSKPSNGKGKSASIGDAWDLKADDLIDESSFSRKMGDIVDTLLEKADVCLDEFQGKVKPGREKNRGDKGKDKANEIPAVGPLPSHLLNANIQPLPQHKFSKKPDNSRESLWRHSLVDKPHAQVPLSWKAPLPGPDDPPVLTGTRQGMYCAEGDPRENPYYVEIGRYTPAQHALEAPSAEALIQPPQLQKDDPTSGPIPFLWVDDGTTFDKLYNHLAEQRVKEIAIDVEHHNFRSYQGLVCLVQVSTRWQDFIIDALSPQVRNVSHRLNEIFADPGKVKILHGAEHDILWLQRDMNIYIVGLFDTYHATNVLNFPYHSLAFLLQRYINFEADKRYQLADWRIRPLNKEMMFYARSDTHSLIYVYDCLRFELEKKEKDQGITKVFELSKRTASKVYAKEEWDPSGEGREGWRSVWKRMGGLEAAGVDDRWENEGIAGLTKTERVFRALHDWRDLVAREEDESPKYILNSSHVLNLSSRAPTTQQEVIPFVGPMFKKRAADLARVIAREVKAFEAVQKEKGEREREKLRLSQANHDDEETGEVINRDVVPLWPIDESSGSIPGPSAVATFLFQGKSAGEVDKSTRASLFAPLPKAASASNVLNGIRSELTSALKGIIGLTAGNASETEKDEEATVEPETVPFVAKEDRAPLVNGNMATSQIQHAAEISSTSQSPEVEMEPTILQVKKDKKDKKRRAVEDQASPKEKKAKWTKEQKEQRKKERDAKAEALKNVVPFDYSSAKSVLDAKPVAPTSVPFESGSSKKKSKDKKKGGGKSEPKFAGATTNGDKKEGSDRYASITVRRDRREQQGGKSMSFST